ncbi:MAG: amidohydrolase family protein [Planctomycetota bacterium]
MQIQDAHTHFFSRPFFQTLAALSPRKELPPAQLIEQVAAQAKLELPSEDVSAHCQRWIAELDRHAVRRAVCFASLPPEAEAVSAAARQSQGRLIPYTIVNPADPQAPAFAEKALGSLGFRGLLTFPAMHHFRPNDACMQPILELAAQHGAPVIVHCGVLRVKLRDLFGLPRPYDLSYAHPLDLIPAANRHRQVRFVVPHFGGGFLHEALLLGMSCENVLLDTSSSNDWLAAEPSRPSLADVFSLALKAYGAERILFGTDSSTFPRGWRADLRDTQLAALAGAGAKPAEIEAIMGGNLARLLP